MPTADTEIQIYVVTHKDISLPATEVLTPIRSDRRTGDHIAEKEAYCELRAQYWVWKNRQALDYVGFFHFRRYLDLRKQADRRTPYRITWRPNPSFYTVDRLQRLLAGYDLAAPLPEPTGETVWKRYGESIGHQRKDLETVCQIIAEKHPEYLAAAKSYLSGTEEYYGSLYIMKWQLFCSYCQWLFGILEEFDRRTIDKPAHTDGYLGERLFGIWFTYQKSQGNIKWMELPRIHFFCYDDKNHHLLEMLFINCLLPVGSRRRQFVRDLLQRLRRGKEALDGAGFDHSGPDL